MKKLIIVSIIILTALTLLLSIAEDEGMQNVFEAFIEDDIRIEYTLNDAGEATITYSYTDFCSRAEVRIPEELDGYRVVAIGDYAFQYFDSVYFCKATRLYIPSTIVSIGANPFVNWYSLEEIVVEPGNPRFEVTDGALYDNDEQRLIACPLTLEGSFTVREGTKIIGELAFGGDDLWGSWHSALKEIILPDSVEEIRDGAFEQSEITSIKLPASLKTIGNEAFAYSDLTDITFNGILESVGSFAFRYTDLRDVTLPDSLNFISNDAFANCDELESIDASPRVLDMLTVLPEDCYLWEVGEDGCATITDVIKLPDRYTVTIPDTLDGHPVTGLGDYAFQHADDGDINWYYSVTTVVIPASITHIGLNPFSRCQYIIKEIVVDPANECYESVDGILYDKQTKTLISYPISAADYSAGEQYITVKPDTLAIAEGAFGWDEARFINDSLLYITLPEGLREIGKSAFEGCEIGSINIPSTVYEISQQAFRYARIKSITFAEGVKIIGVEAFALTQLDNIEIPSSVETIEEKAFYWCWLSEIKFNEGLKRIGSQAFYYDWRLKEIELPRSLEYISPDAFDKCDSIERFGASDEILEALGREQ